MELVVTEITNMSGDNRCVACWDYQNKRIVRPLPDGHHWTDSMVKRLGLRPGIQIEVTPIGRNHPGDFPHLTEDLEVFSGSITTTGGALNNWFGNQAPHVAETIDGGFDGQVRNAREWRGVRQSVYVEKGSKCSSLIGLNLQVSCLELTVPFDKLRVKIYDGNSTYEIPVSSHQLQSAFSDGGLSGAKRVLPRLGRVHVRIGLARAYHDQPNRCVLMLNGVNW